MVSTAAAGELAKKHGGKAAHVGTWGMLAFMLVESGVGERVVEKLFPPDAEVGPQFDAVTVLQDRVAELEDWPRRFRDLVLDMEDDSLLTPNQARRLLED